MTTQTPADSAPLDMLTLSPDGLAVEAIRQLSQAGSPGLGHDDAILAALIGIGHALVARYQLAANSAPATARQSPRELPTSHVTGPMWT